MINRDKYLDLLIAKKWNGMIKVVTGIRRCGKSTISKLCSRFWDVDDGTIKLGGEVIKILSQNVF